MLCVSTVHKEEGKQNWEQGVNKFLIIYIFLDFSATEETRHSMNMLHSAP